MTQLLADSFALPRKMALFLDFDGTLVGFQDDPNLVHLRDEDTALLLVINERLGGALAIISGRDLRDLSKRVPNNLWRIGNHGLFKSPPNELAPDKLKSLPDKLLGVVESKLDHISGIWIETKGPIIAIHHRAKPAAGADIKKALTPIIAAFPDLELQLGNNVVEVKPNAANKGSALIRQMSTAPFEGRIPVMIGDDTTDEDGFKAAQTMGGFGIKIGHGPTCAQYRISDIETLYMILAQLK